MLHGIPSKIGLVNDLIVLKENFKEIKEVFSESSKVLSKGDACSIATIFQRSNEISPGIDYIKKGLEKLRYQIRQWDNIVSDKEPIMKKIVAKSVEGGVYAQMILEEERKILE